jgi:hypothetical protein
MLAMFLMLTCAVSLTLHEVIPVTIYKRHPDIELVSPIYFCAGGAYYEYRVERVDKGVVMKFDFRFDLDRDEPGSILMYEIRKKGHAISDHQSGTDTIYTKAIENASKMTQLLVFWKIKQHEDSESSVILVEYDNELFLNEDKLAQLYENVNDMPYDCYKCTWSMCNNTTLDAKPWTIRRTDPRLMIEISIGFNEHDNIRPTWIDPERRVSSLII